MRKQTETPFYIYYRYLRDEPLAERFTLAVMVKYLTEANLIKPKKGEFKCEIQGKLSRKVILEALEPYLSLPWYQRLYISYQTKL